MTVRDDLQVALTEAMKAQDSTAVGALRSALAAIANAEAVPITIVPAAGAIEAAVGLGAAEAERLLLTDDEQREVVEFEINERLSAITDYETHGRSDASEKLKHEVATLQAVLADEG
ncbi:hypothetical protein ACSDQ9_10205 [Aestuariimicrobium soli]|uniref:hypothetical protein n=1 Tax=Aestuariimicrobium soli TaxID=2035834 RepID=UPI003EBB1591